MRLNCFPEDKMSTDTTLGMAVVDCVDNQVIAGEQTTIGIIAGVYDSYRNPIRVGDQLLSSLQVYAEPVTSPIMFNLEVISTTGLKIQATFQVSGTYRIWVRCNQNDIHFKSTR